MGDVLTAPVRAADSGAALKYSVCSMVTRPGQYAGMRASFDRAGFSSPDCEYLSVDNSHGNRLDAYQACNHFLLEARGRYIVICHQDVVLLDDGRRRLDEIVDELDAIDPKWGLFGNSGFASLGRHVVRISDPHGDDQNSGGMPARVVSLDENFIVVRRDANLAVSHDLHGFHLYGTDLCVLADILGHTAYVVDFHLQHLSGGVSDATFAAARAELMHKYAHALRTRWIATPSAILFLSGAGSAYRLMGSRLASGIVRRLRRLAVGRYVRKGTKGALVKSVLKPRSAS